MRSSFSSRALVAALLIPVVAGIIVAQPAQAAVSHAVVAAKTCKTNHNPKDRDTTGHRAPDRPPGPSLSPDR